MGATRLGEVADLKSVTSLRIRGAYGTPSLRSGQAPAGLNNRTASSHTLSPAEKKHAVPARLFGQEGADQVEGHHLLGAALAAECIPRLVLGAAGRADGY